MSWRRLRRNDGDDDEDDEDDDGGLRDDADNRRSVQPRICIHTVSK